MDWHFRVKHSKKKRSQAAMSQGTPTPNPQAQITLSKKIILLESTNPSQNQYKVILWAAPPTARVPYWASVAPNNSAYVDATQQEIQRIKNGEVVEKVDTVQGNSVSQVQSSAETAWTDWNNHVQAYNPWTQYGSYWDGTTWVPVGLP